MSEAVSETSRVAEQGPAQLNAAAGVLARLRARRRRSRAQAEARRMFVVENLMARSIEIAPKDTASATADVLLLPPFGARTLTAQSFPQYDFARWTYLGLVTTYVRKESGSGRLLYLGAAAFVMAILLALVNLQKDSFLVPSPSFRSLDRIYTAFYHLLPLAAPLAWGAFIVAIGLLVAYLLRRLGWLQQAGRAVSLILVAISVIFVAALCPALTVMYFGLEEWSQNAPEYWLFPPATFGRMLQVVFVIIAALLPALLYFLFDRQKVSTVRKTFYRQIVMLDPALYSSQEAEEKYGHLINEVYGDKSVGYYLVNVGLPIALSSILIAVGWLMILLPTEPDPTMGLSGIFRMFEPHVTPTSFGFLGAYFFTLNMVFRRYVRSDLTPKAYSQVTVRLLTTTILVWAVSALPTLAPDSSGIYSPVLLILAFCLGVVPETGIKVLQEFLRKALGKFNESLIERDPLTELEGINLYDRARLSEEGVDNVENLAHYNMIHLLVQTRIPVSRLVDMFDQAILYLHLRDVPAEAMSASAPAESAAQKVDSPADVAPPSLRDYLRSYGIRTATDLLSAWQTKSEAGESVLETILRSRTPELADRLMVIVSALQDDDWMPQLRYWRVQITQRPPKAVTDPLAFIKQEVEAAQGQYGSVATTIA